MKTILKNKIRTIKPVQLLLLTLLGMHSAAQATEALVPSAAETQVAFDGYFYIGAKAGYSNMENSCHSSYQDCDISALGYGIFSGYQFTPWLALELGATDYQDYDALYAGHDVNADIIGYDAALKLSLPITDNGLAAYLKAGVSYMDITRNSSLDLPDVSGMTPLGALGLEYQLSSSVALRLEYQYLNDVGGSQGHFTSLGVNYRFGQASKPQVTYTRESHISSSSTLSVLPKSAVEQVPHQTQVIALLFGFDSSRVDDNAKRQLDKVVNALKQSPEASAVLTGHTDSMGPQGYNLKLSKARATAIAQYLMAQGIANSRIDVNGMGESKPIASNDLLQGRMQNRRVEILY